MNGNYSNTAILKKILKGEFVNIKEFFKIINTNVSAFLNSEIVCSVQIVGNSKLFVACKALVNPKIFKFFAYCFVYLCGLAVLHPANTKGKKDNFYTLYCIYGFNY